MAIIRRLSVAITGDANGLKKGMKSAKKSIAGFASDVRASTNRMAMFGAAALAAGAAVGIAYGAKVVSAIDSTQKFADRIGVTGEKLVGLQHAAELSGASTEVLRKGLQNMVDVVAEAASGTGTAVKALDTLGLKASDLTLMDPVDQFKTLADAMERIPGESEKVNVAIDLFGTRGAALKNTMTGGAKAINEAMQEAKDLGITFDRFDAKSSENLIDAMTRLKASASGAFQSVVTGMAPLLTEGINKVSALIKEARKALPAFEDVFIGVSKFVGKIKDNLDIIIGGLKLLQALRYRAVGADTRANLIEDDAYRQIASGSGGASEAAAEAWAQGRMADRETARANANLMDRIRRSQSDKAAKDARAADFEKGNQLDLSTIGEESKKQTDLLRQLLKKQNVAPNPALGY